MGDTYDLIIAISKPNCNIVINRTCTICCSIFIFHHLIDGVVYLKQSRCSPTRRLSATHVADTAEGGWRPPRLVVSPTSPRKDRGPGTEDGGTGP
jgi:hypothetical protein